MKNKNHPTPIIDSSVVCGLYFTLFAGWTDGWLHGWTHSWMYGWSALTAPRAGDMGALKTSWIHEGRRCKFDAWRLGRPRSKVLFALAYASLHGWIAFGVGNAARTSGCAFLRQLSARNLFFHRQPSRIAASRAKFTWQFLRLRQM